MANNGTGTVSGPCVRCSKPSANKCSGCFKALPYDEDDLQFTVYCSSVCQKADWAHHKSKCKKLQARNTLERAAALLNAIIYLIRLHASPFQFKSMRLEGSSIFLIPNEYQSSSDRTLKPFSVKPGGDMTIFEAVLVYEADMEAMMYLHSFARELLSDLCSKVEEVSVTVTDRRLRIIPILSDGTQIDRSDPFIQNLYRITLKNGEVWAVDPTMTQYGYSDLMCPWPRFENRISGKIDREDEIGFVRHQIFQYIKTIPSRHMILSIIEKEDLTKALESFVPTLAREYGDKLNAILKGSNTAFVQAKDKFAIQLNNHLKISMKKLYTLEQVIKRNEEVERQLSQNLADLDGQNLGQPDEFMAFRMPT